MEPAFLPSNSMYSDGTTPISSIPALVVSGFLGAGKTTLIQHVLRLAHQEGLRIAIVSNEFGELGIDKALLGNENPRGYVELEGGCVCCQLSDDLLNTLQRLWEDIRPDRVVVETSGVALPFDTVLNFWREPVSQWVEECLAAVVVNAEQLAEGRDIAGTFEQQVSSADLLVLNKIDLVSSKDLGKLETRLRELAPGTPVLRARQGAIDMEILFPLPPRNSKSASKGRKETLSPHTHEAFESEEIRIDAGVAPHLLIEQIQRCGVLRAKGFVHTSEGIRLLQGVGSRIDLVVPPAPPPDHLLGRIVLIRRANT